MGVQLKRAAEAQDRKVTLPSGERVKKYYKASTCTMLGFIQLTKQNQEVSSSRKTKKLLNSFLQKNTNAHKPSSEGRGVRCRKHRERENWQNISRSMWWQKKHSNLKHRTSNIIIDYMCFGIFNNSTWLTFTIWEKKPNGKKHSNLKKQKQTEEVESPSTWGKNALYFLIWAVVSTCRPFCQSVVDVMNDSVSSESCKPLYVQTFKSATILTDLGSERRDSIIQRYWRAKNTVKPAWIYWVKWHKMTVCTHVWHTWEQGYVRRSKTMQSYYS